MAELMLSAAFAAAGLADAVIVDSAGTTAYEAGHPIDPRAARKLTAHSLASDRHIAREWRREWFTERHLILALDVDHYGWLRASAPDDNSLSRIRMLRSFDPTLEDGDPLEQGIEDPLVRRPRRLRSRMGPGAGGSPGHRPLCAGGTRGGR
jgi:protein-tyrosine phosphatase